MVVGFTSGAFDLLHAGHVEYLEKAKAQCDILIVGLNSDDSVQQYKGKGRPIVPQMERAKLLAGLTAVDYIFIFSERRNQQNIESLNPDLYIKAGDYTTEQLTSKEAVTACGGQILLIPIETPTSTSKIIEKIRQLATTPNDTVVEYQRTVHFPQFQIKSKPAIFLDRDGTINADIEYLHEPEKFQLLPNALAGLKKMQNMGYRLILITTQAGIGLGYFTKEDFYRVNRTMFQQLAAQRVMIDKIYFCPHNITEDCACRKPKTALIEQAKKDLNIDLEHSFMIGDRTVDIQTGIHAGLRTILVATGKSGQDGEYKVTPDYTAKDLLDAANWILARERQT